MERNAQEVRKMREKIIDITIVKLVDVLPSHKTSVKDPENGKQRRKEKRLEFEQRREDERRKHHHIEVRRETTR